MNDLWKTLFLDAGLTFDSERAERFDRYLDLLIEANQRMNLTRIADRSAAEIHHVADALTLLKYLPPEPAALSDVGSGGGVPGLILAIARPDISVTLIESTRKKAAFLQSTAATLDLGNVAVLDDRAEIVGRSSRRESFNIVTARAVGSLHWLAEWCLPLVEVGGKFLAMKGARITEELPAAAKAIHVLGGATPVVHPVEIPGTEHHVIVEIAKIKSTDSRYPRDPTATRGKPMA